MNSSLVSTVKVYFMVIKDSLHLLLNLVSNHQCGVLSVEMTMVMLRRSSCSTVFVRGERYTHACHMKYPNRWTFTMKIKTLWHFHVQRYNVQGMIYFVGKNKP